jgi:hypothetical protein
MKTPKITLQNVSKISDALESYNEAQDGEKIFGIEVGATWNFEDSVYYAECYIGDGESQAIVRLEQEAWKGSPDRGSEFELLVYDLGDELGEWLQSQFGTEYQYGVQMS